MTSDDTTRTPLTRARVLEAAIALADRQGLGALTMRRLGAELGYEAMSLYKHVANKDAILDGMIGRIIDEIEVPAEHADWKEAMRRRAHSARAVLTRHPWALGLLETRAATSPAVLAYLNAVLGNLLAADFSARQAARAFWLLDSYIYGQVVQESSLSPGRSGAGEQADRAAMGAYPHLAAIYRPGPDSGYSLDSEFTFGLELILDGLERLRNSAAAPEI